MLRLTSLEQLPMNVLEINPRYRRKLDPKWVKDIVENYDPDLVEALQVSHRDGHYYVLDGQHTLKALEEVFSDDNFRSVV